MILRAPRFEKTTNFTFDPVELQQMHCGLFRHPANRVGDAMPYFAELITSAPVEDLRDFEVDIKIHMLMKGQYPCIPNWHCDNVPRGADGKVDYRAAEGRTERMFLWISDGPLTEFLAEDFVPTFRVLTHEDVAEGIHCENPALTSLPANTWASMCMHTPHRGTVALKDGWRVFVRLTPKSIAPDRPVYNTTRRHCQVYLDANTFTW